MKIAVLSDIHSNHIALKTCVNYALKQDIKTFIFLGDYLGELAYPQKTMSIIHEMASLYECYFIRGNREDYWINYQKDGESGWQKGNSTTGTLLYTYSQLTKKDMDFFKSLPICNNILQDYDLPVTICHGSPYKTNQQMLPNTPETLDIINASNTPLILCGHTHVQRKIEECGKRVINPGSVGVPLYSNGHSQFLILHENKEKQRWDEEFISLTYDVKTVIEELYSSGLNIYAPYWCQITEQLLKDGKLSHGTVLAKAMELCESETGSCIWPNIPEKYYEMALNELGG